MKASLAVASYLCMVAGLLIPQHLVPAAKIVDRGEISHRDTACENTAASRSCWGDYNINTDYYNVVPDTGVTREFWLVAQQITAAPDGYRRLVLAFNGTIPGPTIEVNWGDNVIIHVTNDIANNGTAVHWHGIRQLNNNEYDGVPGVTQCPIAPGESMTYKFLADQYGTTWYHSHFSIQTADGLSGPIIIHGPATANYDEHLGALFLTDWSHVTAPELWISTERSGLFPVTPNGLINGTNTLDCAGSTDAACLGTGKRFETTFQPGLKYRIGLVGAQADGFMRFTIDNHMLTVIASDLVPIVPYQIDSLVLGSGQRYDIIVEANQAVGNYWMRANVEDCNIILNSEANNILGIVRYEGVANPGSDPTTTQAKIPDDCSDQLMASLVPWLPKTVGSATSEQSLDLSWYYDIFAGFVFHWTINSQALAIDWAKPTLQMIQSGNYAYPADYSVKEITAVNEARHPLIISSRPDLSLVGAFHPIHLHGHDYYVIAQGNGLFVPGVTAVDLQNPPRRDTAILPGNGYLVIAFYTDNPGAWLMHCHIAWHAAQGFALQFVERQSEISATIADPLLLSNTCASWDKYVPTERYVQDDSGI